MTPEQMKNKAMDLFTKRFHCSQAVLAVGQEKMGIVNQDVLKALGAFGGGIAGTCRTCGCLTGGMALISSLFSRGNLEDKEDPRMWSVGHKFIRGFENLTQQYGGTDCRDIARMNFQDREMVKDFYGNPDSRRKICIGLVGDTACLLGKILEEEGVAQS
ncbi:MAG: C-GCAxxG-C-C family protein [Desulfobacteraceae bacterium]|nr:C-GCAxxG-C-C family protein [Desulfobacteraceae bacterium]